MELYWKGGGYAAVIIGGKEALEGKHMYKRNSYEYREERPDREGLLRRDRPRRQVAEDIEWIIPGEDWPLAGTRHGRAGLADLLQTASKTMETFTEPREYVARGDRVLVIGFAKGKVKATTGTFGDQFVFAITVHDGKLTKIGEYIDTQALARASEMAASSRPRPIVGHQRRQRRA
jgi:hypothetical protein